MVDDPKVQRLRRAHPRGAVGLDLDLLLGLVGELGQEAVDQPRGPVQLRGRDVDLVGRARRAPDGLVEHDPGRGHRVALALRARRQQQRRRRRGLAKGDGADLGAQGAHRVDDPYGGVGAPSRGVDVHRDLLLVVEDLHGEEGGDDAEGRLKVLEFDEVDFDEVKVEVEKLKEAEVEKKGKNM